MQLTTVVEKGWMDSTKLVPDGKLFFNAEADPVYSYSYVEVSGKMKQNMGKHQSVMQNKILIVKIPKQNLLAVLIFISYV